MYSTLKKLFNGTETMLASGKKYLGMFYFVASLWHCPQTLLNIL